MQYGQKEIGNSCFVSLMQKLCSNIASGPVCHATRTEAVESSVIAVLVDNSKDIFAQGSDELLNWVQSSHWPFHTWRIYFHESCYRFECWIILLQQHFDQYEVIGWYCGRYGGLRNYFETFTEMHCMCIVTDWIFSLSMLQEQWILRGILFDCWNSVL